MASITVSATTIPNYQKGGSTASIRIFTTSDFFSGGLEYVSGFGYFYQEIACTVAGTTVTVPSFSIHSTTDSTVDTARYVAVLYDNNGNRVTNLMGGIEFSVPPTPASTSWEDLMIYNQTPRRRLPDTFYTANQVNTLLEGVAQDWGEIGGTLSDQTDLQTALSTKQDTLVSSTNIKSINGSSLLGSGDLTIATGGTGYAMRFNETYAQHLNAGYFWERDRVFGKFYYEAWINIETGSEYIISDGYGGAHNLLWGFNGVTGGYGTITGNVYIDGSTLGFASNEGVYAGDWHHLAVGWDYFYCYVWIDGVMSKKTTMSGVRKASNNPADGVFFFFGSDHSNGDGYARGLRGIEGLMPQTLAQAFKPDHNFKNSFNHPVYGTGNRQRGSNIIFDFSTPANVVADHSDGMSNGVPQIITNTVVAAVGITGNGNAKCVVTANGMSSSPKTVTVAVTTGLTTASQIAAALRVGLKQDPEVSDFFAIGGTGADIILYALEPQANDSTMNFTIQNDTSTGITNSLTATQTKAGYAGQMVKHPGVPGSLTDGADVGSFSFGGAPSAKITNLPTFEEVTFAGPTTYRGTTTSTPVGAVVFDSFERRNVTYAWDDTLALGTAPTGQVWAGLWGILDAGAFSVNVAGVASRAVIDAGKTNVDCTVTGKFGSYFGTIIRYTDASNYIYAQSAYLGADYVILRQVVAGADTELGNTFVSGTAGSVNSIRIVSNGSNVKVYVNGSVTATIDQTTTLLTGNSVGLYTSDLFTRIDKIEAY